MSIYTNLSKDIGLKGQLLSYPGIEEARVLYTRAVQHHETVAFREVFRYQRFGRLPSSDEEMKAAEILHNAFKEAKPYFENH